MKERSFRNDFDKLVIKIAQLKPFLQKALKSASSPTSGKVVVNLTDDFKNYSVDENELVKWIEYYFYINQGLFLTAGWVDLKSSLSYLSKEHKIYLCTLINRIIEKCSRNSDESKFFKVTKELIEKSL